MPGSVAQPSDAARRPGSERGGSQRELTACVENVDGDDWVNDAIAQTSAPPRLAGVVAYVDRLLPVLWIGVYLLLPVSGWAGEMFDSWFDQQRDLEALRSLLANGKAEAIADSVIGPAYIGAAAVVHEVFGLSPEDALIALTRASYALSVAAGLLLVRVLLRRLAGDVPPMISLASQFVFLAAVFAAGTWYWSDVPWSHFFAAFLAVAVYAARFAPRAPSVASAALVGVLFALLAGTRTFELVAVLLAWGIVAGYLLLVRAGPRVVALRHVVTGCLAFVAATALVYAGTGKRELFFLYGNHLDRQSGSVSGAEIAETPTLSLGLVPTKLVQLFVDPCYLSLCRISDYETGGGGGSNLDLWSLPLLVQLPVLVLLPACLVAVGVLGVRVVRRRGETSADATVFRPVAEMTIAATGLVVGYAGSTLTGPSHLRYGFARDFLLPALLTAIVAVAIGARLAWRGLSGRKRLRVSPQIVYVVAAMLVSVGVVALSTSARSSGLPRIEGRHVGSVTYTARCSGQDCVVGLGATTTAGDPIEIPASSTLTFGCASDAPRLTVYAASLEEPVRVEADCSEPRLVAAWPTVMGLPPGAFELAAVSVRNI
jgi:hypothetical protein